MNTCEDGSCSRCRRRKARISSPCIGWTLGEPLLALRTYSRPAMSSTSLHCRSHVRSSVPPRCVSRRTVEFRPRLAASSSEALAPAAQSPQLSAAAIRAFALAARRPGGCAPPAKTIGMDLVAAFAAGAAMLRYFVLTPTKPVMFKPCRNAATSVLRQRATNCARIRSSA